uniref:AlNc14C313G10511 protein n=1 Tax=Albugo laibachii Nc14 TaxID=890382 RepID=F0WW69_9STRA|nr:AlNc14C313G10511 [Albugo laibachii Nc14]|eukprot:CCA25688.1 AlNc14C313G10511 [Albugo laibachii Nc14]
MLFPAEPIESDIFWAVHSDDPRDSHTIKLIGHMRADGLVGVPPREDKRRRNHQRELHPPDFDPSHKKKRVPGKTGEPGFNAKQMKTKEAEYPNVIQILEVSLSEILDPQVLEADTPGYRRRANILTIASGVFIAELVKLHPESIPSLEWNYPESPRMYFSHKLVEEKASEELVTPTFFHTTTMGNGDFVLGPIKATYALGSGYDVNVGQKHYPMPRLSFDFGKVTTVVPFEVYILLKELLGELLGATFTTGSFIFFNCAKLEKNLMPTIVFTFGEDLTSTESQARSIFYIGH